MAANGSTDRRTGPGDWARAGLDELSEFFTLRWSEARSDALAPDVRGALERDMALAVQRRQSAELLHQHGSRTEALRLIASAHALLSPHAELATTKSLPNSDEELQKALEDLPLLDDGLAPEHADLFDRALAAELRLERTLGPISLPKPERRRRRVSRIGTAFAVLIALLSFVFWSTRHIHTVVEASASWGPKYAPENITDGNEQSSWLLPDRTLGWIELKIDSPRQLSTVSLLNNWDPPTYGINEYRVEVWSGDKIVQSIDGQFNGLGSGVKPSWVDVPVTAKDKASKVRIVAKSYWNLGGGLAEVKLK